MIVLETARLAFKVTLDSENDGNRTVVQNLGRAIIKKITIKISGEVMSIDDSKSISLEYDKVTQPDLVAMRFASLVLSRAKNLRVTTVKLPEPVALTCWRLISLLEYLANLPHDRQ